MDYLLSRESYARLSRNHSLKLGRSFGELSLLTKYPFGERRSSKKSQKILINDLSIAQPNC